MNEIYIKLGGTNYKIKLSFRSLMIFENITGKAVGEAQNSVNTIMLMFYSILKGCNKNFEYDFEQFVDLIDEEPETVEIFSNFLAEQQQQPEQQAKKKTIKKR